MPRVMEARTYLAVCDFVVDHLAAARDLPDGYTRIGDSLVHAQAYVASDATLVGPVLIGPGAHIMSGATVIGPTSLGRCDESPTRALVARSVVWRRSIIGERSVADRCILPTIVFSRRMSAPFAQSHGEFGIARPRRRSSHKGRHARSGAGFPSEYGANRWSASPPWAACGAAMRVWPVFLDSDLQSVGCSGEGRSSWGYRSALSCSSSGCGGVCARNYTNPP